MLLLDISTKRGLLSFLSLSLSLLSATIPRVRGAVYNSAQDLLGKGKEWDFVIVGGPFPLSSLSLPFLFLLSLPLPHSLFSLLPFPNHSTQIQIQIQERTQARARERTNKPLTNRRNSRLRPREPTFFRWEYEGGTIGGWWVVSVVFLCSLSIQPLLSLPSSPSPSSSI